MRTSSSALLSLCLAASLLACQKADRGTKDPAGASRAAIVTGAPVLEMFVMSQCPYGTEVVDAAAAARKQLDGALTVKLGFIGDGAEGSLSSMHGPSEVKGDLAQVCAIQQAPDKFLDMIVCQNENARAVDTNWKECATKVGMDASTLAACIEGPEGQKLLAAAFAEAKQRGASGSPTIFLDGKSYEGGRKPKDLVKAACGILSGAQPAICKNLPVPPTVNATFFSDTRCKECDISQLEPRLKGEFGGLVVKHVDYMSPEGKALYQELVAAGTGFKMLPAVLMSADIAKDTDGFPAIQQYLKPIGNYQELQIGGQFDPTAEICDNGSDDDANGKSDCDDESCKEAMVCRPRKAKTLDLFVMSQCPYGAKAMIAAKEFVDHFGDEATLNVHFIGDQAGGQLQSMHGPEEVNEDIRERCAIEKYSKNHQFLRYLSCRSLDYKNTNWQPCATDAGMDPEVIQTCFDGEGKQLLGESFALASALKIGSSPTWLANNKRMFNAVAASDIQHQFCEDNPGVAKCAEAIPPPPQVPGQAPAPAGQCD